MCRVVRGFTIPAFIAVGTIATFAQAQEERTASLFVATAVETDAAAARLTDPTVMRIRSVNVRMHLLGTRSAPATTVQLNLFDDVSFTAHLERAETTKSGSFVWVGRLEGIDLGQAVLTVTDGVLAGSVSMPDGLYQVRYAGNGAYAISQIDQSEFPEELEPIPSGPPKRSSSVPPRAPDLCTDIAVMVAYSPEAQIAAGGVAAIESLIALAVAEANQSYVNSGLTQRLTLVHTLQTDPSDAANDFSTDLGRLQNLSDGFFDNVDAARETYDADEVALIIENAASCGLGYVNSTEDFAFSVTHRTCATGYYSFAHELGHNMSARHDWYIDDSLNSPYSYSRGWVYVTDRWRTIMAYNNLCADSPPGTGCTRLQYWSNPNVSFGGIPMGVNSAGPTDCVAGSTTPDPATCAADNRTVLNSTCDAVANFRSSTLVFQDGFETGDTTAWSSAVGVPFNVADGSFEGGSPNASWSEASTNFGTPLCTNALCGGGAPRTGSWFAWFGGTSVTEDGSLTQVLSMPAGTSATLNFYLSLSCSGQAADYFEVTLNGSQVYVINGNDPSCGTSGYVQKSVDISAYLGTTFTLSLHSAVDGPATMSFFVDDVSITHVP